MSNISTLDKITAEDTPDFVLQEFFIWYYEKNSNISKHKVDNSFFLRDDIQLLWLDFFKQSDNLEVIKFWNKKCG